MIRQFFRRLCTAFAFLTRFPLVARFSSGDASDLAASARYFPLVGYVVGAIGAMAFYYSAEVFSRPIAALLATLVFPILTGAFHEDGLADTADGFGGAFERSRKLEIMKDSRIGTYGTCVLIGLFLLRWALISEIPMRVALLTLVSAHVVARWSSVIIACMLPYVREGASNKPVADGMGWKELLISTIIAALWLIPQWQLHALSMVVAVLISCIAAAIFRRQIGGVTGDVLGAANIVIEIAVLMSWNVAGRMGFWAHQLQQHTFVQLPFH